MGEVSKMLLMILRYRSLIVIGHTSTETAMAEQLDVINRSYAHNSKPTKYNDSFHYLQPLQLVLSTGWISYKLYLQDGAAADQI